MNGQVRRPFQLQVFLALERLFKELDLDPDQPDLRLRVREVLNTLDQGISQGAIMCQVVTNTTVTKKIIDHLVSAGLASLVRGNRKFDIRITEVGAEQYRRDRAFYERIFSRELGAHARYVPRGRY